MPKKQQKNAFFFYMQDKMQEFQRAGYTVQSISDCVPLAHPRWKAEPPEVKKKYEEKAKAYKQKMRGAELGSRLDNTGKPISEYRNPDEVLDQNRNMSRSDIGRSLPSGDDILKVKFYFIHFEYLLHYEDDDEFYPAEVALVEYSMFSGIHRTYHKLIKPAEIPKGWKFDAKARSEQRHKLPYDQGEQFDGWNDNYYGMWNEMCEFVNPQELKPNYPPVYCLLDEYKNNATVKCLDWVYQHARAMVRGMPINKFVKVYALEDLLLCLFDKSRSDRLNFKPSEASVHDELRVTKWDFEPNTCCSYHEEKECRYCSLGFVKRWCYAISDFFSSVQAFRFDLTENHVPSRPIVSWMPPDLVRATPSGASVSSNSSERGQMPGVFSHDASYRDEARDLHSRDDLGSGGSESGSSIHPAEQPRLLQQSRGRGSALPVGLGRGATSEPALASNRGRGRGNFFPDDTIGWGRRTDFAGVREIGAADDFPSLRDVGGSGNVIDGSSREGAKTADCGAEDGWRVTGGGKKRGGRGRGDGGPTFGAESMNDGWSSMGRGRGTSDVFGDGALVVGRGRGFNQSNVRGPSPHVEPPGFRSSGAPRAGTRGVPPMTVRGPPPGFSIDDIAREGGAEGGVEAMSRGMAHVQIYDDEVEDWS